MSVLIQDKMHLKEKYINKIDKELGWRKKEINAIKVLVNQSNNSSELLLNLRMGYVMLYSHWEGIIKKVTKNYLEYINKLDLKVSDLEKGLLFLQLKKNLKESGFEIQKSDYWNLLYDGFQKLESNFDASPRESLTTQNLNFKNFKDFVVFLGVEEILVEKGRVSTTKKNLINQSLVQTRHSIAHGERGHFNVSSHSKERPSTEVQSFNDVLEEVINIIERFKDAIITKIQNELFIR